MSKFEELKDIVTLSKETGISLSEAISLYREYQQAPSEVRQPSLKDVEQPKKTEEQDTGKEQPEGAPKNEQPPLEDDKVIEYKKKVEELEKKVQDLQKENINKDVSGQDTKRADEDSVNDITRAFM